MIIKITPSVIKGLRMGNTHYQKIPPSLPLAKGGFSPSLVKRGEGRFLGKLPLNYETLNNDPNSAISNEKGIALVMVLILSAIALAIMAALIYMLTASTQVSGIQKRYRTALEAGKGGADVTYRLLAARGNPNIPTLPACSLPCTGSELNCLCIPASNVGGTDCLTPKLNSPTSAWPAVCSSTISINPNDPSTYDMSFDLGTTTTYRVYSKIVDTVNGNSGGEFGLLKSGVVGSNSGEITVMSMPYFYTIEIDAENRDNPQERAKYSILYEY